jgi:thiamine pyrophosphate-dependent acetolactate synthase large subunit-like protein
MPVASGDAVARPDRKVIFIMGDTSAMHTLRSFGAQAREGRDVTASSTLSGQALS